MRAFVAAYMLCPAFALRAANPCLDAGSTIKLASEMGTAPEAMVKLCTQFRSLAHQHGNADDNYITKQDFQTFKISQGESEADAKTSADHVFSNADKNANGQISFEEFAALMKQNKSDASTSSADAAEGSVTSVCVAARAALAEARKAQKLSDDDGAFYYGGFVSLGGRVPHSGVVKAVESLGSQTNHANGYQPSITKFFAAYDSRGAAVEKIAAVVKAVCPSR